MILPKLIGVKTKRSSLAMVILHNNRLSMIVPTRLHMLLAKVVELMRMSSKRQVAQLIKLVLTMMNTLHLMELIKLNQISVFKDQESLSKDKS